MKLKVKHVSDLVLPLTILNDFVVQVRRLTSRQTQELFARCSKSNVVRGGQTDSVLDDALWLQHAPDAYVAGWQGLTAAILRELGIDLEDEPLADSDGTISYDAELAREVWREAQVAKFAVPIVTFSREMLGAAERQKKSALMISGGSSSA